MRAIHRLTVAEPIVEFLASGVRDSVDFSGSSFVDFRLMADESLGLEAVQGRIDRGIGHGVHPRTLPGMPTKLISMHRFFLEKAEKGVF